MKMSPSDEKTYPKLHDYVKNRLPTVLTRPRIARALRNVGCLTPKQAVDALTYGNDPSMVLMFEFVHSGKLAFKVGATLLHELVHWSTFHHHKANGTVNLLEDAYYAGAAIGRNHELGDRFERAAYQGRSEHYDFLW